MEKGDIQHSDVLPRSEEASEDAVLTRKTLLKIDLRYANTDKPLSRKLLNLLQSPSDTCHPLSLLIHRSIECRQCQNYRAPEGLAHQQPSICRWPLRLLRNLHCYV